jgi:hypothetical protein
MFGGDCRAPTAEIVTVEWRRRLLYCAWQAKRGIMFFRMGTGECIIILVVLIIVVGLAYRGGYFRGRRRD